MKRHGTTWFFLGQPLLFAVGLLASYALRPKPPPPPEVIPAFTPPPPGFRPSVAVKGSSAPGASPTELVAAFNEGHLPYFEMYDRLSALVNERIAEGDFDGAMEIFQQFPERHYALIALGSAIGKNLERLPSIEEKLMTFRAYDRRQICGVILNATSLPPEKLVGIFALFPGTKALGDEWSSNLIRTTPEKLQQAIDYINTIPDSPFRQKLMSMALVGKGCRDGREFAESLSLLHGETGRTELVNRILGPLGPEGRQRLIDSIEDEGIRHYVQDTWRKSQGPG